MHILMTAYACHPSMGSEHGNGWNWPTHVAARGHEVTVLTTPASHDAVEAELHERPRPGLSFEYVPVPAWPLRLGWTVGSALQYLLWQEAAAARAARLHAQRPFDLLHHVSYGSLLGGSRLHRVGPPVVFGPIGGGQTAPPAFARYFGRYWRKEMLRTLLVRHGWCLSRAAVGTVRTAVVLAANRETAALARRMGARRIEAMLDVGLPEDSFPEELPERPRRDRLELLWVGRILPRKGLDLCLDVVERCAAELPVRLTIVGDDYPAQPVLDHERLRRLGDLVEWRGSLPWSDVAEAYRDADAFLFTSLRDSCGVQLLEAMTWGLPVITLDHQGAALLVPDEAGFKVPVTTPSATVAALVDAVGRLAKSEELRRRMGEAAFAAARQFTWERRVEDMEGIYRRCVDGASVRGALATTNAPAASKP
jgi:glycosyltransferase involved in cell wall biosynthesis